MDNGVSMQVNGKWIPAIPLGFMCEIAGCVDNKELEDYVRNPEVCDGGGWDDEPIMLCKKHGENHVKVKKEI